MNDSKNVTIFGDGQQSRDFTYISNAVSANILASDKKIGGHIFNVGSGQKNTIIKLVNLINETLPNESELLFADARDGDVKHSFADVSKAQDLLGYEPNIRFRKGLKKYIETVTN